MTMSTKEYKVYFQHNYSFKVNTWFIFQTYILGQYL